MYKPTHLSVNDQFILRERGDDEITRLLFQDEAWKERTDFAIELAIIQPGDNIIDMEYYPGYLELSLHKREILKTQFIASTIPTTFSIILNMINQKI